MNLHVLFFPFCLVCAEWKVKSDSDQYQCTCDSGVTSEEAHVSHCLQIRSEETTDRPVPEVLKPCYSSRRTPSSKPSEAHHRATAGPDNSPDSLPQEEPAPKASKAKHSSPKARKGSRNTPSPPGGRAEKKQKCHFNTISPSPDSAAANSLFTEQMSK